MISWQRRHVYFARNVIRALGTASAEPVAAVISATFAEASLEELHEVYCYARSVITRGWRHPM